MKFFSPKPKKLFIFKERILKICKNKQENRLKIVSYDVFSTSTTAKHRGIHCLKHITVLFSKV